MRGAVQSRPANARIPKNAVPFRTRATPFTGFALHASQLAKWFFRFGCPIEELPPGEFCDERIQQRGIPWRRELVLDPLLLAEIWPGNHWLTMWETSAIPSQAIPSLKLADSLIVPSQWNAQAIECATGRKPALAPLGHDPKVFFPGERPADGLTIFGAAGRMAHGEGRKLTTEIIPAFLKAFPDNPNVRLHVKAHPDCGIQPPGDPRIEVTTAMLKDEDMGDWIRELDVFCSLSRGEGWGLFQHQALACGKPVIGALFGGVADFLTPDNSYMLPYFMLPATGSTYEGAGFWAEVDEDDFIDALRFVEGDRAGRKASGERAVKDMAPLTWEAHARKVLDALTATGFFA